MSPFVKHYPDSQAARRAVENHRRLWAVMPGALPRLIELDEVKAVVVFEDIGGRPILSHDDVLEAARMIGRLQRLWGATRSWHDVRVIPFSHDRRAIFESRWRGLDDPGNPLASASIDWDMRWRDWDNAAVGLYKDCNVHNFRLTPAVRFVDFGTLTPAPVGYDLAKLLVTVAMRDGRLPPFFEALAVHGDEVGPDAVPLQQLACFLEMHWILTYPFAAKNSYRVPWPELRSQALELLGWPT